MIPDLNIPPDAERPIWLAMKSWPDHFQRFVASHGIEGLIGRYEELVESIETQSCLHGPNHRRQTGSAWQSCCGISYEYLNDLAVRDVLETILTLCPGDDAAGPRAKVATLDDRLYGLYAHHPTRAGTWWREGLPRGIVP